MTVVSICHISSAPVAQPHLRPGRMHPEPWASPAQGDKSLFGRAVLGGSLDHDRRVQECVFRLALAYLMPNPMLVRVSGIPLKALQVSKEIVQFSHAGWIPY